VRSQFVLSEVWIGLRRNLTMTMALIVVVAISLSLLGTGFLFVKQVDRAQSYWEDKVEVAVFFCVKDSGITSCQQNGPATQAEETAVEQRLSALPEVQSVTYIPQAANYQGFRDFYSGEPSFVNGISESEIPDSLAVKLKNPTADATIAESAIVGAPGVADVINEETILNSFYQLLDSARNAVAILALVLLIAAALLVANTIRLSAFNRRRETSIMRLVGASNFYIQLPFLTEGAIAGLIGWVISAVLLVAVKSLLLNTLAQYFNFDIGLSTGDLIEVIVFSMLIGVLLCGLTSFLTLRRYLRI
jgi:cell division transport system permease protein